MSSRKVFLFVLLLWVLVAPRLAFSQEVKCYAFQRGAAGDVADAYLAGHEPAAAHGEGPLLLVGGGAFCETSTLLWFDLSQVPSAARVAAATVTLQQATSSAQATLTVHRVTAPWVEDAASWSSCIGAFDPYLEASFDSLGPTSGPVSFDLTDLVQLWIDGSLPNDGVMISQRRGARTVLVSSEQQDVSLRPRLDICFEVDADPDPAAGADEGPGAGEAEAEAAEEEEPAAGSLASGIEYKKNVCGLAAEIGRSAR